MLKVIMVFSSWFITSVLFSKNWHTQSFLPATSRSMHSGILSTSCQDLALLINGTGRAKMIWQSLKKGQNPLVDLPSNKTRSLLTAIVQNKPLIPAEIVSSSVATCGTTKYLQRLHDGLMVESVLIPAPKFGRTTLCVSTQVGCDRACAFCATGKMGLIRNLTSDEILAQVFYGLQLVEKSNTVTSNPQSGLPPLTNVVFMGMGDAGRNLNASGQAIIALTDQARFGLAELKVAFSTVGPSPEIFSEIAKLPCSIAWSVHSVNDALRKRLVPSTKHSMVELRDGLVRGLASRPNVKKRTIMLALTLIEGVNDEPKHGEELVDFLRPMYEVAPKIVVDLIPYNDIGVEGFRQPSRERVIAFQRYLRNRGVFCSVRLTRGDEESAACGMLTTKKQQQELKRERRLAAENK